jgi:hypothetical protein
MAPSALLDEKGPDFLLEKIGRSVRRFRRLPSGLHGQNEEECQSDTD